MKATPRSRVAPSRPRSDCNSRTVITSTSAKRIRTWQNGTSSAVLPATEETTPTSHRHRSLPDNPVEAAAEAHRPQDVEAHRRAARILTVGNGTSKSAT